MTTTRTQPPAGRHVRRLERLHELVATLPTFAGQLGADVRHLPEERLLERNPTQPSPHIDALNMATIYGERTDGCGTVGCLAGLTILAYPEEAAEVRSRTARERNVSERIISMFEVATRVLGLDQETRDALFFGLGTDLAEDFVKIPKRAVLAALDRTIAGRSGTAIWHGDRHDGPDMTADQHGCLRTSGPSTSRTATTGSEDVAEAERLLHRGDRG